jgi:hypothetical protein
MMQERNAIARNIEIALVDLRYPRQLVKILNYPTLWIMDDAPILSEAHSRSANFET